MPLLVVHQLLNDLKCPVICMDEQPIQLVKETPIPLSAKPGQPQSVDYETNAMNGTANIFMFTEPLSGWRKTVISEGRKRLLTFYSEINLL